MHAIKVSLYPTFWKFTLRLREHLPHQCWQLSQHSRERLKVFCRLFLTAGAAGVAGAAALTAAAALSGFASTVVALMVYWMVTLEPTLISPVTLVSAVRVISHFSLSL